MSGDTHDSGTRQSWWQRAAAPVALVAAIVALAFDLVPSIRPDPRSDLGGELTVLAVEPSVSQREWLRRQSTSDGDFRRRIAEYVADGGSREGLRLKGQLAYVRTSIRGYKGRSVSLRWSIYDQATQRRRTSGTWDGDHFTRIDAGAPVDALIAEEWVRPVVGPRRSFFLRVEIRNRDGVLLGLADSKPFRGQTIAEATGIEVGSNSGSARP